MGKKKKKQEVKIKMFNNYELAVTFDDVKIENIKNLSIETITEESLYLEKYISRRVTTGYELTLQVYVPYEQMKFINL